MELAHAIDDHETVTAAFDTVCETVADVRAGWTGSETGAARLDAALGDLAHHVQHARPGLAPYLEARPGARVLAGEAFYSATRLFSIAARIGFDEAAQVAVLAPVLDAVAALIDALEPNVSPAEVALGPALMASQPVNEAPASVRAEKVADPRDALRAGGPRRRLAAIDDLVASVLSGGDAAGALTVLDERLGFGAGSESARSVRVALIAARRRIRAATKSVPRLRTKRPDDLATLPAGTLLARAIVAVDREVSVDDGWHVLHVGLAPATPAQRELFAIWWTMMQVVNGGFPAYFGKPTGMLAPLAVAGMQRIGAIGAAGVLARAMAVFPGGPSTDHHDRVDAMAHLIEPPFEELERDLYLANPELVACLERYIRANPDEFFDN